MLRRCITMKNTDDGKKILVVCAGERFGAGDDVLGRKLMINFLCTLKEMGDSLWRLVFVNGGVKFTIDTSGVFDDLAAYEAAGLKIMVCTTCLNHFDLLDKKRVGEATNMVDIVSAMELADSVIRV
ncbi:MAG: sulfurtransferase-like selenium metabolism protein YedF [Desulfofustis sp. PB-SRB1]|nr:sulfurtransferase-like selenium metabolism protein YedF [Desulfofustis sp. PB-SRB1]MBM1001086.1 sulfurtransferase-like selenium metabolism protein YedF [Desulfofustis sp. PB-SRB1]HBH30173.1 sulfurtransferase-like selenium metabolism protein YedF [Desulfofustis sp.]HBH30390.1 sulfurtransferase-like selenium metabolism protein YedF [Desulfofustis sp.]